jgi:hypothetical protein
MAVPMKLAKITREVLFFPSLGSAAENDAEDMESPLSWCWMFVAAWCLGAFFFEGQRASRAARRMRRGFACVSGAAHASCTGRLPGSAMRAVGTRQRPAPVGARLGVPKIITIVREKRQPGRDESGD